MTISLKANAAGTQGEILVGATPVAQFPVASGLPFCKNKLFNGEVTRINQRGFDGNWATKNTWSAGNTIEQQELCYGYDMWAKSSTGVIRQVIEAGNFRPSTVHALSCGNGVFAPYTAVSPASGNWAIDFPEAARNIQVEEGTVATPFEIRPINFELEMCQRYFQTLTLVELVAWAINGVVVSARATVRLAPTMRAVPVVAYTYFDVSNMPTPITPIVSPTEIIFRASTFNGATGDAVGQFTNNKISAVI